MGGGAGCRWREVRGMRRLVGSSLPTVGGAGLGAGEVIDQD